MCENFLGDLICPRPGFHMWEQDSANNFSEIRGDFIHKIVFFWKWAWMGIVLSLELCHLLALLAISHHLMMSLWLLNTISTWISPSSLLNDRVLVKSQSHLQNVLCMLLLIPLTFLSPLSPTLWMFLLSGRSHTLSLHKFHQDCY